MNNNGIVREARPEELQGKRNAMSTRAVALEKDQWLAAALCDHFHISLLKLETNFKFELCMWIAWEREAYINIWT